MAHPRMRDLALDQDPPAVRYSINRRKTNRGRVGRIMPGVGARTAVKLGDRLALSGSYEMVESDELAVRAPGRNPANRVAHLRRVPANTEQSLARTGDCVRQPFRKRNHQLVGAQQELFTLIANDYSVSGRSLSRFSGMVQVEVQNVPHHAVEAHCLVGGHFSDGAKTMKRDLLRGVQTQI